MFVVPAAWGSSVGAMWAVCPSRLPRGELRVHALAGRQLGRRTYGALLCDKGCGSRQNEGDQHHDRSGPETLPMTRRGHG